MHGAELQMAEQMHSSVPLSIDFLENRLSLKINKYGICSITLFLYCSKFIYIYIAKGPVGTNTCILFFRN
jgi:hypothetical protein